MEEGGEIGTSETASRSFCAGCFLVDPDGLRMLFVSVEYKAANLGLLCSTDSSIGGSILPSSGS